MIWCRVKSEKRSFRPSPAMLESEKRSFRPSPAMLERTRKNSELNIWQERLQRFIYRFFWRKTSGTKIIQQDTSRWLNWISNLNSMCFLQWKSSWWRFVLQTSLVLGTRLSPGWTWHMWLVPMGRVIWLIQLFEMYKPQVDLFSGWDVLKKLVALSSGLCFILLHAVKSVNNVIAFRTINLITLWTAGSMTLKQLQALFDSSRLFNASLNTK